MHALFDSYRVPVLGCLTCSCFPVEEQLALAFAQPDRAITCMDGQRLTAAVHFAVHFRILECSLYGNRDTQADVAVAGAGVDVRLEIGRENYVHAAVTRSNRPAR